MRQGLSLYDVVSVFHEIEDRVLASAWEAESEEVQIPTEMIELLDGLKLDAKEKCIELAKYLKNVKAECQAIGSEVDRLKRKKKFLEVGGDRVRGYLLDALEGIGEKRVTEKGVITASIMKKQPRVEADETARERTVTVTVGDADGKPDRQFIMENVKIHVPDELDDKFCNPSVYLKVSKTEIKEHWGKTGEVPKGVTIIDDDKTVRVS